MSGMILFLALLFGDIAIWVGITLMKGGNKPAPRPRPRAVAQAHAPRRSLGRGTIAAWRTRLAGVVRLRNKDRGLADNERGFA